jgi:iron complex outermembrane receptor protein
MRIGMLTGVCMLISISTLAQAPKGKVTVTVTNEQKTAMEGATVELLRSKDSSLVKTALTNKAGLAELEPTIGQSFMVRASTVGYQPRYTEVFTLTAEKPALTFSSLSLDTKAASQLAGVTVTAKKPFIQRLTDRTIVNVESSIVGAGANALDVLEQSPGVVVDQNDAISLRGRAGVIIMIDGKVSPMSGTELANYLRGLPSNAIERFEIITNPSAKYDAAGNSGIIDIRLKKDQRLGTNGTFTAGFGQGKLPKANGGLTLNNRNKKTNFFGNYNYRYSENLNHLMINRNFYNNGVFAGADNKDNYAETPVSSHNMRLGADFFPSKKTILGFVMNSSFTGVDRRSDIKTEVIGLNYQRDFTFNSIATNNDDFNNTIANINFKHSFNTAGRELTADVDYGVFNSSSITRTASNFYNLDGSVKSEPRVLDGDQDGKLTLKTAKVDYTHPLKGGAKLEAGYKTSMVSSDNDAQFWNVLNSGPLVDVAKTNRFFYEEYNNAGYVNFSKEFKKFNLQLGLRGEQTDLNTRQVKGDERFKTSYFELFPSAYFNYKLKENQTVGVSVSRRIDRPGYQSLNPFLFQIDPGIYSTGNPLLMPQMTWSYEANYTLKSFNFTLAYSHTDDVHNSVLSPIKDVLPNFEIPAGESENITVQFPVNLASLDYYGFTASLPVRITKWWNMMNNLSAYYQHFDGKIGNAQLNDGAPAANIRTNNTFTFKKGWTAELNANLNTGGRYGYAIIEPQWGVAVGGQKTVLKGKGTVRLNVTDIFWTNLPKATVTYEGRYIENWHAYRDSRVANLSFTYRFGNNKVQAARNRKTGSEEEARRAGN